VLSDEELVALVLRTGPSAGIAPAASILRNCGGLAGLPEATPGDFLCDGVGPARSASLLAALELARRLAREEVPSRAPLGRPAAVATYLNLRYRLRDQEVMGAIFLDTRNRLISDQEIFRGTLHRVAVEPRPVLREALLKGASSVILFHTHPSGDPTPSLEDLAFTRRMAAAAEAVGVDLQDHLILGSTGRWVSLKERGAW
jgi:DNA repair protein RadC